MLVRNIGSRGRIVRVAVGGLMVLCGLVGLSATPLGLAIAGVGAASLITGMVRYCPACALVAGKPITGR